MSPILWVLLFMTAGGRAAGATDFFSKEACGAAATAWIAMDPSNLAVCVSKGPQVK